MNCFGSDSPLFRNYGSTSKSSLILDFLDLFSFVNNFIMRLKSIATDLINIFFHFYPDFAFHLCFGDCGLSTKGSARNSLEIVIAVIHICSVNPH